MTPKAQHSLSHCFFACVLSSLLDYNASEGRSSSVSDVFVSHLVKMSFDIQEVVFVLTRLGNRVS